MTTSDKPYTFDRVVRMVITLVLFGLFGFLIWYLRGVLVPFAIAMLIAYLMNPLVNLIQKRVENRVLSVVLSIMAVTVVLGGIAIVMVPLMIAEVQHLGQLLQGFVENNEMAQRAKDMLPENIWKAIKEQIQREEVQEFFKSEKFLEIPGFLFQNVLPDAFTVISSTVSTVFLLAVGVATVILYLVFLLIDFGKVQDRWSKLIPAQYREKVVEFVNAFEDGMSKYFRGQALVAASVGVICATGYTIIGLPLGILLGLFVGLLNMVPYLSLIGIIPAFMLAVIYSLESGEPLWLVLIQVFAVSVIAQVAQDAFLVPKIMGDVTGLSPAIILLSLAVWGKLLGFLGLLLAIPNTVLVLAYYEKYLKKSEEERGESGTDPPELIDP